MGTGDIPSEVKRQIVKLKASINAKLKKTRIYTSIPTYTFMEQCLICEAQEQCYLLYIDGYVEIWQ
jgi:hypothetical protein